MMPGGGPGSKHWGKGPQVPRILGGLGNGGDPEGGLGGRLVGGPEGHKGTAGGGPRGGGTGLFFHFFH